MSNDNITFVDKDEDPLLSFASLRADGIKLLERLSGNIWTDFNLHDPGVTILEQLCFAITDIAYRGKFSIEKILQKDGPIAELKEKAEREELIKIGTALIDSEKNSFLNKRAILSSNPVTINDFRKIIIDEFDLVENAWLETDNASLKTIKGFYTVFVQVKRDIVTDTVQGVRKEQEKEVEEQLKKDIKQLLAGRRNVCEYFDEVVILEPQRIEISAEITITENNIVEDVLARIFCNINDLLNPRITFYTEAELLSTGLSAADIYTGPLLHDRMIPDAELKPLKEQLDILDVFEAIVRVEEVLHIDKLKIRFINEDGSDSFPNIKKGTYLKPDATSFHKNVKLINNKYQHAPDEFQFKALIKKNSLRTLSTLKEKTRITDYSKPYDIAPYYSLQRYFPTVYGIGAYGLDGDATTSRKAYAMQLKAYLMVFEQLLANHLAQLANLKNLFRMDTATPTYFVQGLYDVPKAENIIKHRQDSNWNEFTADENNSYITALKDLIETSEAHLKRKELITDHILARYNEDPSTYPLTSFRKAYRLPLVPSDNDFLSYKIDYFNSLLSFGNKRGTAYNYLDRRRLTALEKRIILLLNIKRCSADLKSMKRIDNIKSGTYSKLTSPLTVGANAIANIAEPQATGSYTFKETTLSFFKDAIDIDNYCICKNDGSYNIYYFAGEEKQDSSMGCPALCRKNNKHLIGVHPSYQAAVDSRKKLINKIKALNINSEGFHILEHILLAPPLSQKCFTFKYTGNNKKTLFRLNNFVSYEERNTIISALIALMNDNGDEAADKFIALLAQYNIRDTPPRALFDSNQSFYNYVQRHSRSGAPDSPIFGGFRFYARMADGKMIDEDFFSMQMTVLLPSWPARFQNEDFSDYIEEVFAANIPAHIRVAFKKMNIGEMKEFEDIFFEWMDEQEPEQRSQYASKIAGMVASAHIPQFHK